MPGVKRTLLGVTRPNNARFCCAVSGSKKRVLGGQGAFWSEISEIRFSQVCEKALAMTKHDHAPYVYIIRPPRNNASSPSPPALPYPPHPASAIAVDEARHLALMRQNTKLLVSGTRYHINIMLRVYHFDRR